MKNLTIQLFTYEEAIEINPLAQIHCDGLIKKYRYQFDKEERPTEESITKNTEFSFFEYNGTWYMEYMGDFYE